MSDDAREINPQTKHPVVNCEGLKAMPCEVKVDFSTFIDWQARAEKAEQRCAELAAALERRTQERNVLEVAMEMIRIECDDQISPYPPVTAIQRIAGDHTAILAQHDAQVERETLEQIAKCMDKTFTYTGDGYRSRLLDYAEREFAPKGESDAKRD